MFVRRAKGNRWHGRKSGFARRRVAKPPLPLPELQQLYGPHPQRVPPGGWQDESRNPAEKLVKTDCCFCGQQCGIQLKVWDNKA
jgi:assimilatory nitrate reductase catalytic subunit